MSDRRPHHNRIDISIVVPAHNEEDNVGPLLDQFAELGRKSRFTFEVILVDDGSTDRTLPRVVDAQRQHRFVHIVSIPHRRGLTEALQAGFSVAQGNIIVFYPADRQFHPNDIPKMVEKVREGFDLVTGRKIGEYNKRVVSGVYNRISRLLFPSIPVTDLNSVKAFRRELIDAFDYRHDWHRFWVAIVAEAGYRVGEVDVTLYKRTKGRSKFGVLRIPGGVLDLLAVKFQYHTMRRPLWYFGISGTILLGAALILGIWALYERFINGIGYRPLVYLVMTLGLSGLVFFVLGFLAEAVAGVRQRLDSVKGGPRRHYYQPPTRGAVRPTGGREESSDSGARSSSSSTSRGDRGDRGDRKRSSRGRPDDRRGRRPGGERRSSSNGRENAPSNRSSTPHPTRPSSEAADPVTKAEPEPDMPATERPTPTPPPAPLEEQAPSSRNDQRESETTAPGEESGPTYGRRNRR